MAQAGTSLGVRTRSSALLVPEDGYVLRGKTYGASGRALGEIVFNTGMTGYQETLTDPSYHRQIVVMTAPHIGNTGVNDEDPESSRIRVAGYVVRDPARRASSWRARRELEDELEHAGVVGVCEVDTRALTRHLREHGAMRAGIFSGSALPAGAQDPAGPSATAVEICLDAVRSSSPMTGQALAAEVSTTRGYVVEPSGRFAGRAPVAEVAAIDLGIKAHTPSQMAERGVRVRVLPRSTTLADLLVLRPDGVFISNGPGDPAACEHEVALARGVLDARIPLFGICLGNQVLGRCFTEAIQKAMRSVDRQGSAFHWDGAAPSAAETAALVSTLGTPTDHRLVDLQQALRGGASLDEIHAVTRIAPWFLDQMLLLLEEAARELESAPALSREQLERAKRHGFSDVQVAALRGIGEDTVRELRHAFGVRPVYKTVDTCAAEFAARTPYHYSTYDAQTEVAPREREAVIILGSGPNRIGQGIELDYSCVHATMALAERYETIMVNCNPETVSTDYDVSDRLYVEPLTFEDVMEVYQAELDAGPVAGMVVQLGGQTPLSLAARLKAAGVPILGTSPEAIHAAEDREAFGRVLEAAGLPAPAHGTALSDAEIACIRRSTEAVARGVGVPGLINIQFALLSDTLYVIEANPRASRTVPFVSKATGVPLAKAASLVMVGRTIASLRQDGMLPALDASRTDPLDPVAVKEAVLPFKRFRTPDGRVVDTVLGPEMRSTGEVMGYDTDFPRAFAKSQDSAYGGLPNEGTLFVSVADRDKRAVILPVARLAELGFTVLATTGTAQVLRRNGIPASEVRKVSQGAGEHGEMTIVELIEAGMVDMVVNTPHGQGARADGYSIRAATTSAGKPIITTVYQLQAAVQALEAQVRGAPRVRSLQEHDADRAARHAERINEEVLS